ncbi:uncharacterized protein LOC110975769 isoform X2 [Acanthaster planci]|uniref:Uncharacterized protein LOC110975769 isoform X2 n=1 Tax=Acanthaster planci TaxID=133434 RepID=A0A8B7XW21_ACAPL|nr:uncharacterized protein LOC110975769 isoform X2 [Acanthaster planci]
MQNDLREDTAGKATVNIAAVCHAIREIVYGIERDRTDAEKDHWNFKLHASLFVKLLERRKCEDENVVEKNEKKLWASEKPGDSGCSLSYFEGVSRGLPDNVDLNIYLGVSNTFEWGPLCAQVLHSLDPKLTHDFLEEIAAKCMVTNRTHLLISILTGLLAPSSCDHRSGSIGRRPDVLSNLPNHPRSKSSVTPSEKAATFYEHVILSCEFIHKVKSVIENRTQRFEVMEAVTVCLNSLVSESEFEEKHQNSQLYSRYHESMALETQNRWTNPDLSNEVYKLHLLSSTRTGEYIQSLDHGATLRASQRNCDEHGCSPEKLDLVLGAVTKMVHTLRCLLTEDWVNLFVDWCDSDLQDNGVSKDELLVKNILKTLENCLGKMSKMPIQEHTQADITSVEQQSNEIKAYLSQVLNNDVLLAEKITVTMETDEAANEQRGHMWLVDAINRVDERMEGYEDDLSQLLLLSDQWEDDLWIECLERNTAALTLPRFVEQLIGIAMAMDGRDTHNSVLKRVLKVLLASYCALPFLLQNEFRDRLWSYQGGVSIFARRGACHFDQESTTAFNKLVTLPQGKENTEVLTALSCLALQSPALTLRQAVKRAVSNAAVCQAVCQVLQAMPSLATFKEQGDRWPLLCYLIWEATETLATSANEEANLIQLVSELLQPFKPLLDPHCPFWLPPVLPSQGFTHVCILPHLRDNITEPSSPNNLLMALKFLKKVINLQEFPTQTGNTAALGSSLFPIMLCLYEVLDSCRLLWDGVAMVAEKADVKEVVQGLLGKMGRIAMVTCDRAELEHGASWLINRVTATMHWTTVLAVQETLPECQQQQRLVPASLISFCHLADQKWVALPSRNTSQNVLPVITLLCDQVVELLLCCRTSESLANILSKGIRVPDETSNRDFLEAVTLGLLQVLPHSIMGEWQCIMGMLTQLLTNEVLMVPCSAKYVTELPMANISVFRVHLGLSQLLLSVLQLLTSPCCQEWATPPLLHHVTRCYVGTMQKLLSEMLNSDLASESGCLFAIGQFFCHACEVIGSLATDDLKEQVFVLALEYLSQMEEITAASIPQTQVKSKQVSYEWTNQVEVFKLLANQKLAGEQRRTLLQKIRSFTPGGS